MPRVVGQRSETDVKARLQVVILSGGLATWVPLVMFERKGEEIWAWPGVGFVNVPLSLGALESDII